LLVGVPYRAGSPGQGAAHITPADAGALLLVVLAGMQLFTVAGRRKLRTWTLLPLVALAVSIVVSGMVSADHSALSGVVRYLEIFVLVPAAAYLSLDDAADLKLVLAAVLGLAAVEGAIGAWQYFTGSGAGLGASNSRAVGTFGVDEVIAMSKVVTYGALVGLAYALTATGRRARLGAVSAGLLVLPLLMSVSRGSWLAASGAGLVMLLLVAWRRAALLVALVATLVVATVAIQGSNSLVLRRMDSLVSTPIHADPSVKNRYRLWDTALNMWERYPIFGVGPKAFPDYRDRNAAKGLVVTSAESDSSGYRLAPLLTPHSLYLLLLAETGAVGFLALLGLLGWMLAGCVLAVRAGPRGGVQRTFIVFALGFAVAEAMNSVYGDVGGSTSVLDAVLIGCALWVARAGAHRGKSTTGVTSEAIS
jgi:O-antigen ligase